MIHILIQPKSEVPFGIVSEIMTIHNVPYHFRHKYAKNKYKSIVTEMLYEVWISGLSESGEHLKIKVQ